MSNTLPLSQDIDNIFAVSGTDLITAECDGYLSGGFAVLRRRLRDRVTRDDQALLHVVDGILRIRFVLQRDRSVGGELDVFQCLEDTDDIEVRLADDDVVRSLVALVGIVLDVQREDTITQLADHLDWILIAANVMSGIDTRADPLVVAFHRCQRVIRLVEQRSGAVIVNADTDVVLGNQLIQTAEGVWIRVRRDVFDAGFLGKLKNLSIRVVIGAEPIHAVGIQRDVRRCEQLLRFFDRLVGCVGREMLAVKLDVMQPHALDVPNRFVQIEVPQRVALHANRPALIRIVGMEQPSRSQDAWGVEEGGAGGGSGTQSEESATGKRLVHGGHLGARMVVWDEVLPLCVAKRFASRTRRRDSRAGFEIALGSQNDGVAFV